MKKNLLGDFLYRRPAFANLNALFRQWKTKQFVKLTEQKKSERIQRTLLTLIQKEPEPCFLLPAVMEFIEQVVSLKLLEHYSFTSFELWLNQCSNLSFEENYRIRAKIAGKWIHRSDYQDFFPIGIGQVYEGTHFVTAHHSPDLDTTVASFWGWMDAFAARVGNGLHIWNLPGEPTSSRIEIDLLFHRLLGPALFNHLPKMRTALTLTSRDLITQERVHRKTLSESLTSVDSDIDRDLAVILVDEDGFYLGDWRAIDVEGVRQVIILFGSCLRWFEQMLYLHLISHFAKERSSKKEMTHSLRQLFQKKIGECPPVLEFTTKQKEEIDRFLIDVLKFQPGLNGRFEHLLNKDRVHFLDSSELISGMQKARLFQKNGRLIKDSRRLMSYLKQTMNTLHQSLVQTRASLEQFDIALGIKEKVFGHHPTYVTLRSEIEEIHRKMSTYSHLTVVVPEGEALYPVGIIQAADLQKSSLGTVSLRDFCNREEMTIPMYIDVISVIDHHKSSLKTISPPIALISDVQSSNTLVAECAMKINDRYKTRKGPYFIHPDREFLEYIHFLYAILDDTDLLVKVTARDVIVVASLLNRLKSLSVNRKVEVVSLDHLAYKHPKEAAQDLLQTEDLYSLYSKLYRDRKKEFDQAIHLAAEGKPSRFFVDTKEQNGCCRVGQTKLFSSNIPLFQKKEAAIRHHWVRMAIHIHQEHPELDFHLHMISTIASAEEVFKGTIHKPKKHLDELWIWIASTELGIEHLKMFLSKMQRSFGKDQEPLSVEFPGTNADELSQVFKESFREIPHKKSKSPDPQLPIAILRYRASSLNSRKAQVSPYLPILS